MKTVILVPTYNEKSNILRLLDKILEQTKRLKERPEILVVDDNSPDGTSNTVLKYAQKHKKVFLHTRKNKEGLGAAYLSGLDYAFTKMKAGGVIVMDADLSHDPVLIPRFIDSLKKRDLIIGSRYIKGGSIPENWAPHRKFYSVVGNKVASLILNEWSISDWTSGYRAIKKEVYLKVAPKMKSKELKGYTFNMSFAYFSKRAGFRIDHVPLKFIDRTNGKSKLGMEYLFHTPIFLFKTRLREILHI